VGLLQSIVILRRTAPKDLCCGAITGYGGITDSGHRTDSSRRYVALRTTSWRCSGTPSSRNRRVEATPTGGGAVGCSSAARRDTARDMGDDPDGRRFGTSPRPPLLHQVQATDRELPSIGVQTWITRRASLGGLVHGLRGCRRLPRTAPGAAPGRSAAGSDSRRSAASSRSPLSRSAPYGSATLTTGLNRLAAIRQAQGDAERSRGAASVRSRKAANGDSTGLVVRRCVQCSRGKAWNAVIRSESASIRSAARAGLGPSGPAADSPSSASTRDGRF